jgi:hypothetical protein
MEQEDLSQRNDLTRIRRLLAARRKKKLVLPKKLWHPMEFVKPCDSRESEERILLRQI